MSKISQCRALLLAAIVPAVLIAGCSSGSDNTQAMKGAASPATPTDVESMSPEETGTDTMSPSPSDTGTGGAGGQAQAVVQSYFNALKSGNVDQVASLFTPDAVVAMDGEATAEGAAPIKTLFQEQLKGSNEQAQATHTVDDSQTLGSDSSIVRTTSKMGEDTYRELFVLAREGGEWKISQFMNNQAG
ncbi:YybH family protein [Nonomuraea sp. NPDC002799]